MKRIMLALFVLLSLLTVPALAAEPQAGDNLFGATYAYHSPDADFAVRAVSVGLNYERYIVEDFSAEVGAFWPKADPGQTYFSGYGGLCYHFGPLYIPLRGTYDGLGEQWLASTGAGLNFFAGPLNLRFTGLVNWSFEGQAEDRTSWTAEGAVRFKF